MVFGVRDTYLNSLPTTYYVIWAMLGFPDSSVGKESACNAGDLG